MLDPRHLMQLNTQNRPLPTKLRQSRNIYIANPTSGFNDPFTNPFSRFVYKAKADKYYVQPTESTNPMRRQKARQNIIHIALRESQMYPEAAKRQKLKHDLEYPILKQATANPISRMFRPSYYLPKAGMKGLFKSSRKYSELPRNKEDFEATRDPLDSFQPGKATEWSNKIDNYLLQNESDTIQNADKIFPFEIQRTAQNRPQNDY